MHGQRTIVAPWAYPRSLVTVGFDLSRASDCGREEILVSLRLFLPSSIRETYIKPANKLQTQKISCLPSTRETRGRTNI